MAERVTPHDLTAERAVLGAVLLEPGLVDVAEGAGIRGAHFFRDGHRRIWEAIGVVRAAGQVLDTVTLRAALDAAGQLDEIGGLAYIAGLVDGVPRATNVEGYARLVREKAVLRELIAQARQTEADAYDAFDVDEVLDRAEARLMAIGRGASRGDFVLASDWMGEMHLAVERALSQPRGVSGVPCGLAAIDGLTRGWQPADLIVIAGRPSDGKTSLMMQFANEASQHVFAAVVSLEMSRLSVGFRLVALEARVDAFRLMTGQVSSVEMRRIGEAMQRLSERRLAVDDVGGQSVAGLCAKVRRLASRYGAGIVFIDYLQLIHGTGAENRTQEITQISGRLKALAKELNVPVVVLSQLTRDSAKGGGRPQLHNLRDGGSIEQDADVVVLIHRPNKAAESGRFEHGEEVELILAKQRNGPANRVLKAGWDGPTMRFTEPTEARQDGAA